MILFTALRLPQRLSKQISNTQRGVTGTRWSDIDNLHITTCYYGDVDLDIAETLDYEFTKDLFGFKQKELIDLCWNVFALLHSQFCIF